MVLVGIISDHTYREASSSPHDPDQFSFSSVTPGLWEIINYLLEPGELQRSVEMVQNSISGIIRYAWKKWELQIKNFSYLLAACHFLYN